jgi:Spy/CpxP family protein refolding chaperone
MKVNHINSLITRTCCIAGLILLIFTVGSLAQARKPAGKNGTQLRQGQDPPSENKQGAPNNTNAQGRIPDAKLNRNIFERLDLTKDQRQRIRIINRDNAPFIQGASQEVQRRRRALEDSIYADVFDEALYNQRLA